MLHKTPTDIFQGTLTLLEEMTAISSPSSDLDGLRRAAEHLGEALREVHMTVEIRDEPGLDGTPQPVLHAWGPAAKDRYLLVVGHLDTVLKAKTPERRDDRLYATGSIDMKGGLAAFVGALRLLDAQGRTPTRDLYLVVVPDEEVSGPLSRGKLAELGPGARGMWVLEPGQPTEDGETLVGGRRGMFHWHLDVRGTGAHAGNGFWQGRSALNAATAWCQGAAALAQPDEGPTVNAGRMVSGDDAFVEHYENDPGIVGTNRRVNVVPDRARVDGEARFLSISDAEHVMDEMRRLTDKLAAEHEVEIDLRFSEITPPMEPLGLGRRWTDLAAQIADKQGWRLEVEEDRRGISFPNFLPDPTSIPILDGLGPVGDGMHTHDEYVELESLDHRISLLAEMLAADRESQDGFIRAYATRGRG